MCRLCKLNFIQDVQKSKLYSLNMYWISQLCCWKFKSGCDTVQLGETYFSNIVILFFSKAKPDSEDGSIKTIRNARNYSLYCKAPQLRKHETSFINSFYIIIIIIIISVMELVHLLTRSGLTYPEVSSKVCHDFFCQLGNSFYVIVYLFTCLFCIGTSMK